MAEGDRRRHTGSPCCAARSLHGECRAGGVFHRLGLRPDRRLRRQCLHRRRRHHRLRMELRRRQHGHRSIALAQLRRRGHLQRDPDRHRHPGVSRHQNHPGHRRHLFRLRHRRRRARQICLEIPVQHRRAGPGLEEPRLQLLRLGHRTGHPGLRLNPAGNQPQPLSQHQRPPPGRLLPAQLLHPQRLRRHRTQTHHHRRRRRRHLRQRHRSRPQPHPRRYRHHQHLRHLSTPHLQRQRRPGHFQRPALPAGQRNQHHRRRNPPELPRHQRHQLRPHRTPPPPPAPR